MRAAIIAILGGIWLVALTAATFVTGIMAFGAGYVWTGVAVGFLGGIVFAVSAVVVALQALQATEPEEVEV